MKGKLIMKRSIVVILFLCILSLATGCAHKKGTIMLDTVPQGADVYLNGIKQGTTPVTFQWDARMRATLKIEKEGFYTETEELDKAWLVKEHQKRRYSKEYIRVDDTNLKVWTVNTIRELKEKED
jgi:hypothetical protein